MEKQLSGFYIKSYLPGIMAFIMLYLLHQSGVEVTFAIESTFLVVFLVILAALTSIVGPLWYRIWFVRKFRNAKAVPRQEFLRFQSRFIGIGASTVYVTIAAFLLQLPRIPFLTIVLLVLYTMYFYYPSAKRIRSEKKMFRIQD